METLCLACCFIGTGLLILSVILCIVSDNIILWQPEEVWQAVQGYQCTDQNTDIPVQI